MEWRRKTKKKQQPQPPRLQRMNAKKNIDYEPPIITPSTSSSISSSEQESSLRVMGIDGEFDRIFQSLGLSGPEDFAIPTEDWEARKARFASAAAAAALKHSNAAVAVAVSDNNNDGINGDGVRSRGGGIKGVRPPLLAPPVMINGVGSTFGSQHDTDVVGVVHSPSSSGEHDVRGVVGRLRLGERSVLFTDSGSFTTSHDDDSDACGERACSCSASASGVADDLVRCGWLRPTFSSWQKGDILGKGSFGTVYEGFTDDGFFFAVKEVSLLDEGIQGKQSIFQLQQEISLLSQFQHDNIVRYYGSDKNESTLYIFLELVSQGSLASLYQKYRLNDSQVSAYTRQILNGLKYLHDQNVVHR